MSNAARNDQQALRIILALSAEGVIPENITRLLNYHYSDTFQCDKDAHEKASIRRIPDGTNYAPTIEIWKQP